MEFWLYVVIAIVAVLVLLLFTLLGLAVYSGLLHNIQIDVGKPPISNVTIAYKFDRGPYNNCGYLFTEACSVAPKLRTIGIYYDDPYEVPAEKLRWAIGSIIAEGDEKPDEELVKLFEQHGFKIFNLPAVSKNTGVNANIFMDIWGGSQIKFMAPLELDDQFLVPEAVAAASDLTTAKAAAAAAGDD